MEQINQVGDWRFHLFQMSHVIQQELLLLAADNKANMLDSHANIYGVCCSTQNYGTKVETQKSTQT